MKEETKVAETLGGLERISRRVEVISTQILESVGTEDAKLMAEFYDQMLGSQAVRYMLSLGLRPTPVDILDHEAFLKCTEALGGKWAVKEEGDTSITTSRHDHTGSMSQHNIDLAQADYEELRNELNDRLDSSDLDASDLRSRVALGIEPEGS